MKKEYITFTLGQIVILNLIANGSTLLLKLKKKLMPVLFFIISPNTICYIGEDFGHTIDQSSKIRILILKFLLNLNTLRTKMKINRKGTV